MQTSPALLLYEHPLSTYAQKGLPFDAKTPDDFGTGRREGTFAAASPRLEVPALLTEGLEVFDATVILEYVEDRGPTPPLLPVGAAARARARMLEDVCIGFSWPEADEPVPAPKQETTHS